MDPSEIAVGESEIQGGGPDHVLGDIASFNTRKQLQEILSPVIVQHHLRTTCSLPAGSVPARRCSAELNPLFCSLRSPVARRQVT
jgi:hypothetical protein